MNIKFNNPNDGETFELTVSLEELRTFKEMGFSLHEIKAIIQESKAILPVDEKLKELGKAMQEMRTAMAEAARSADTTTMTVQQLMDIDKE